MLGGQIFKIIGKANIVTRTSRANVRDINLRFMFGVLTKSRVNTNRVFGKPCLCSVLKRAVLLRPPRTTKITRMVNVIQAKTRFRKSGLFFFERISLRDTNIEQ